MATVNGLASAASRTTSTAAAAAAASDTATTSPADGHSKGIGDDYRLTGF